MCLCYVYITFGFYYRFYLFLLLISIGNNSFFIFTFSALEVAITLKAGAVWVNAHNLFDAAAGFGGYKESGFGRDGGKEGLYEYVKPSWEGRIRLENVKVCISFYHYTTVSYLFRCECKHNGERYMKAI